MPRNKSNNYAFIDAANLHLGVQALGWKLDYNKFRQYLTDKYGVNQAYMFMGYDHNQQNLYRSLQKAGYVLEFKPILRLQNGKIKGNCDAELVLRTILDIDSYDGAVIVAGDGDYHCLVKHLQSEGKLAALLAPSVQGCSVLLTRLLAGSINYIENHRSKLEL